MLEWFLTVWRFARLEFLCILKRKWLFFTGVFAPVFWGIVLTSIFSSGVMLDMPVGLVDQDKTSESREIARALESIPSVKFESFLSTADAGESLRSGKIVALVVLPQDLSRSQAASDNNAAIELYLNKSLYAMATTIESDIKTTISKLSTAKSMQSAAMMGGTKGAAYRLNVIHPDVVIDSNNAVNFKTYLLSTLIPGVLGLITLLTTIGVLIREWKVDKLKEIAESPYSPTARQIGKILPWFVLFSAYMSCYIAWFAGWQEHTPAGSLLIWVLGGILYIAGLMSVALFLITICPTWLISMSIGICYTAPIFPFTGFSYPFDSMTSGASLFGKFLPLTWYIRQASAQWVLASPLEHSLYLLGMASLFVILPLGFFLNQYSRAVQWKRRHQIYNPPEKKHRLGFFELAANPIIRGIKNPETMIIFTGTVAFYLIFYAWPYCNQTITGVRTAIVDMDRSAVSRSVVQDLKSMSALNVISVETSRREAQKLYQTEEVSAVITIPEHFEEYLLAGKHTSIGLVGNGAFPVKVRAVNAALMGEIKHLSGITVPVNLLRNGASTATVAQLAHKPVKMTDDQLFNPISGYASYIVPVVTPVILQAMLLTAMALTLGGWLAEKEPNVIVREIYKGFRGVLAFYVGFWFFGMFWILYAEGVDFSLYNFTSMQNPFATIFTSGFVVGGIIAFGMFATLLVNDNTYAAQFLVPFSAPAVFLSGVVFPQTGFNWFAKAFSYLLPSTPAMQSLVAVSQNGASLISVLPQLLHLSVLIMLYLVLSYFLMKRRAEERGIIERRYGNFRLVWSNR